MKVETLNPSTLAPELKESAPHHDSSFWSELISQVAERADVNPRIAVLVASHESGLNPQVLNRTSGAIGMMQLLPATSEGLGVDPHNVVENILGGVHYLRQQFAKFGDTAKALAAYNWGPRHVSQAIERWGESWLDHAPSETRQYVNSIISQAGGSTSVGLGSEIGGPSFTTVASAPRQHLNSTSDAPLLSEGEVELLRNVLDAYLLSGILS